jgi:general stress protein CsbA
MSAQPGQLQEEQQQPPRERRSRRETSRTAALLLLAVLATVFAFLNLNQVEVDWIIVIVVSLLAGIVLSYFSQRITRRRR